MNKESIRNKIEDAKARTSEALSSKGVGPEIKAVVKALLLVFELFVMSARVIPAKARGEV